MMNIPICFSCARYYGEKVIKDNSNTGDIDEIEEYCEAFPEGTGGIPNMWEISEDKECANGISFTS